MTTYPKPYTKTLYGLQYDYCLINFEDHKLFVHWVKENEFHMGFRQSFDRGREL